MVKRSGNVRTAKKVSRAPSPADVRNLMRLKMASDLAYNGYWLVALTTVKPPKPPGFFPELQRFVRGINDSTKALRELKRKQ